MFALFDPAVLQQLFDNFWASVGASGELIGISRQQAADFYGFWFSSTLR